MRRPAGSVGRAYNSCSQSSKFEPHIGHRDDEVNKQNTLKALLLQRGLGLGSAWLPLTLRVPAPPQPGDLGPSLLICKMGQLKRAPASKHC